jgi:hypothetical protein
MHRRLFTASYLKFFNHRGGKGVYLEKKKIIFVEPVEYSSFFKEKCAKKLYLSQMFSIKKGVDTDPVF